MSKKRNREVGGVEVALVEIYEDLAHELEEIRLQAAHRLVSTVYSPNSTSPDQIKAILKRLFRGLCSSRKAARLGFSVALTEFLSQLKLSPLGATESVIIVSDVIDVLESETVPEGGTSGQDERDHYFGRLFGAEAIIKSNLLFGKQDLLQWGRLLDIVCGLADKKPWLRRECGWILYNGVKSPVDGKHMHEDFAIEVIEKLSLHKLIRTPEGVAIWLEIGRTHPHAKLPKHVWKHRDPLAKKDISTLADVLKDAKSETKSTEDGFASQGNAMWTAQLHFAWDVVLSELYSGSDGKAENKRISFETFWLKAVDESLFAASSSAERKHWGLLLFSKALAEAPRPLLEFTFTNNIATCLMHSLKGDNRYLQRSAQKVLQSLQSRVSKEPKAISACFRGLLQGIDFVDFDSFCKTKTVEKLIALTDLDSRQDMLKWLQWMFDQTGASDEPDTVSRQNRIVSFQGRLLSQTLLHSGVDYDPLKVSSIFASSVPMQILELWVNEAYFNSSVGGKARSALPAGTRKYLQERLASCFEQGLKEGAIGRRLLRETVAKISTSEKMGRTSIIKFDENVATVVAKAWKKVHRIPTNWISNQGELEVNGGDGNGQKQSKELDAHRATHHIKGTLFTEGLALLYSLVLFQVYNGEAEAVEILEELLHYHDGLNSKRPKTVDESADGADGLIEILLSFASKPSKFLRRVVLQIFEAFAPQITRTGIQSLIRILGTKESVQGQREMFDTNEIDVAEEDDEHTLGSDVEAIETDIDNGSAAESSEHGSDELFNQLDDNQEDDDELAAFDAKLAAALGTRNGLEDLRAEDTSGSSDTDMDDDQMMALDEKLAEVFRTRKETVVEKQERKQAKETIVNFKNRVLDLVEVYLKREYLSPQSLDLVVPLLTLARKSNIKQLADRACNVLREFCSRCKGQNVPALSLTHEESIEEAMDILRAVHGEACLEGSNIRAAACSHASILLVKTLINAGVELRRVIDIYGDTREKQLTDNKCYVQAAFFTDWNNWCAQARGQLVR